MSFMTNGTKIMITKNTLTNSDKIKDAHTHVINMIKSIKTNV